MSTVRGTSVGAAETVEGEGRTRRRRWRLVVAALVVLAAGATGWWWLTIPQLEGGGLAAVSSDDHEVVMGRGLRETVFIVPADSPGQTTIAFGVHNAGRFSVELVDVWPTMAQPHCFWQPTERWFQDDPRYLGVLDDRARPLADAVLPPGGSATVWIKGAHPDPDGCVHGGFSTYEDVEVIARVGGRTSTTRIPLGYTFGYADEPEMLRDLYNVQVTSPTDDTDGDS